MDVNLEIRLALYREMILSCHNLYFWTYCKKLNLLYSNCPSEAAVNKLFCISNNHTTLLQCAEKYRRPIILTGGLNLVWVAVPEKADDELSKINVLGPLYVDSMSGASIKASLAQLALSPALQQELAPFLGGLPVISLSRVFEYAIMLYYCISGKRISVSDLHYKESQQQSVAPLPAQGETQTHGTYEAEQEMLRMVREGNLNYRTHMNRLAITGNIGKLSNGKPLRQMKNTVLVASTLFSRAAIQGGLAPELALTLTDQYFQSVEACASISDLMEISHTMQEDFIQRVHRCRTRTLSRQIMHCCDYIGMHLEEDLSLASLAGILNYSQYYLSRKFKQDTGLTVKDYICQQRLQRGKELLKFSSISIQDISEKLRFCSQSYFAQAFRRHFGLSPTQWRAQP